LGGVSVHQNQHPLNRVIKRIDTRLGVSNNESVPHFPFAQKKHRHFGGVLIKWFFIP
jgi:hypothetical protein